MIYDGCFKHIFQVPTVFFCFQLLISHYVYYISHRLLITKPTKAVIVHKSVMKVMLPRVAREVVVVEPVVTMATIINKMVAVAVDLAVTVVDKIWVQVVTLVAVQAVTVMAMATQTDKMVMVKADVMEAATVKIWEQMVILVVVLAAMEMVMVVIPMAMVAKIWVQAVIAVAGQTDKI